MRCQRLQFSQSSPDEPIVLTMCAAGWSAVSAGAVRVARKTACFLLQHTSNSCWVSARTRPWRFPETCGFGFGTPAGAPEFDRGLTVSPMAQSEGCFAKAKVLSSSSPAPVCSASSTVAPVFLFPSTQWLAGWLGVLNSRGGGIPEIPRAPETGTPRARRRRRIRGLGVVP